jgi:hypothetical protein
VSRTLIVLTEKELALYVLKHGKKPMDLVKINGTTLKQSNKSVIHEPLYVGFYEVEYNEEISEEAEEAKDKNY